MGGIYAGQKNERTGATRLDGNAAKVAGATAGSGVIKIGISGLTRGKDYWARVRAIGTNGPGPWSDPATILVN